MTMTEIELLRQYRREQYRRFWGQFSEDERKAKRREYALSAARRAADRNELAEHEKGGNKKE